MITPIKRHQHGLVRLAAWLLTVFSTVCSASAAKPNVVFILADDLGWSDTTLFGTTKFYRTPNIERLAARGMTFTHAYSSSPLCSPTRASILTGLSPARTGITAPTCHLPKVVLNATPGTQAAPNAKAILPNSVSRLNTDYYTLAEMFRDNGYATGHFGKWHLGAAPYSPLEHGFDVDVPHWPGPGPAGSYVAPWKFPDFDPNIPDEHLEDRMATEAVAFLEQHKAVPFFLNYWMFSVHAPFDAKRTLIDEYRKTVDPNDPQRSPTYAAMIHSMDDAVGRLLDTLDRLKISDNTIIVFASDNGGNMYNEVDGTSATSNAPLRGGKATMYEGGVRGPAILAYPSHVAAGSRSDEVINSCDYYPTLLDLLAITPQPQQLFDGISIVPALNGKPLDRDAIFTFFPHNPAVPDWLPPAVSVHRGDWKMIRLFHHGEAGRHRYKLFNLNGDIGEQHDLAQGLPARVAELDLLIAQFLQDTNAVQPVLNPKFDSSKYQPELEGKGALKGGGSSPTTKGAPPRKIGKKVAGWQPGDDVALVINDASMVASSSGRDPHFSHELPQAVPRMQMKFSFTMTSESSGNAQLFWHEQGVTPAYFRDRSVTFAVNHNGEPHDYEVVFTPENAVVGIRLDPSQGAGTHRLSNIQLITSTGEVLHRWKFQERGR